MSDPIQIMFFDYGIVKLLNSGQNQLCTVIIELFNKGMGIGGFIHTTLTKAIKFLGCLIIKVFSIHTKHHLMYLRHALNDLTGLERSKGFT